MLAVDIGNTTTTFGLFSKGRLAAHFSIGTQPSGTPDELAMKLQHLTGGRAWKAVKTSEVLICSVVPRMLSLLVQALNSLGIERQQVVGQDLEVPLKNRYRYPEQVGQDRLVGAYAAWRAYKKECIVADFGTAITIDLVAKTGEYLGGIIAPGLEISLDALATKTALLPKVELKRPPQLLGRDTANSIRSGVLFGCVALCDGLVTQLKRQYAPNAKVVATGGASPLIVKHSKTIDVLKPHLVLEGLYHLSLLPKPPQSKKSFKS